MDGFQEKAGGYISEIRFNDNTTVPIAKNDIVVFVGPNNVGKSRALKDIYNILGNKNNETIVVKNIMLEKYGMEKVEEFFTYNSTVKYDQGGKHFEGYNYNLNDNQIKIIPSSETFGYARDAFIAYLNTENRLQITNPPNSIDNNEAKSHPIHYVDRIPEYRRVISKYFKKAFGKGLIPYSFGRTVSLCIGNPVKLNDKKYDDEQDRRDDYRSILDKYPQIQNQGDGMRSFTGVLLYLIIKTYSIYLIDEPESFLHPPQAGIMGRVIGSILEDNQQAFIATHSQELIKGLIETCPERIKIIRITRNEDTNKFSILDYKVFEDIWKDSILRHSNILNGIFHKTVVLCESDSDCKLYSIILSKIKEKNDSFSEAFFIQSNGKHRMAKIVSALKALNIDILTVADIDILSSQDNIKKLVESYKEEWSEFERDYKILDSSLRNQRAEINRDSAKKAINRILDSSNESNLTTNEIDQIRKELTVDSKWNDVKKNGKAAIPSGDSSNAFTNISQMLKKLGIYIVECGEIENFVKTVGSHGPDWVNKVLEKYPDLNCEGYKEITKFVESWGL